MKDPICIGDTVTTKNIMLLVEATNPATGEDGEIRLDKWSHVKIVALPDAENPAYLCETKAGWQFYMERDAFSTADE